jgi:hypothetical protein
VKNDEESVVYLSSMKPFPGAFNPSARLPFDCGAFKNSSEAQGVSVSSFHLKW